MAIEMVETKHVTLSRNNVFHVPVKQWKKWSPAARMVFNEVYSTMLNNQYNFRHPKSEQISKAHWSTTSWNAGWTAADATDTAIGGW